MIIIKRKQFECLRCGWSWFPRKEGAALCPRCKTPYWNKIKNIKRATSPEQTEEQIETTLNPEVQEEIEGLMKIARMLHRDKTVN